MAGSDARVNTSLRRTLLAWLLVPLMLVAAAGAGLQYWLAVQPAQEALDRALADATLAVGNLLRAEQGRVSFVLTPESEWLLRADRLDTVYYAVLGPGGDLVAGDAALARLQVPAGAGSPVLADALLAGDPVRAAALRLECGPATCEVRMAETLNKRQHIERDAVAAAAFTLALIAAASAIAIALAVRRGLRPLAAVQHDIGRRSLDDLSALDSQHAPSEVKPLLEAINQLFTRLRDAATAQRAFIADAAHQLRTPLANLRTETELAVLEPHPPELDATLQRLAAAAARSSRLAEQLLALARAERTAQAGAALEQVDLRQLAADSAQEWVPRALAVEIDLGFELQPAQLQGKGYLLREMLANLVHNALQYAGAGARVTVRTAQEGESAVLEVEDNGPGIPQGERDRVFERFVRGAHAPGAGSGLGLAIVRDIAQLHRAQVRLLDGAEGRGLKVKVQFLNA